MSTLALVFALTLIFIR